MFAVDALSGSSQAIVFFVAFVLFVVAGVLPIVRRVPEGALIPFGLAAFTFVFFWNALAAS